MLGGGHTGAAESTGLERDTVPWVQLCAVPEALVANLSQCTAEDSMVLLNNASSSSGHQHVDAGSKGLLVLD